MIEARSFGKKVWLCALALLWLSALWANPKVFGKRKKLVWGYTKAKKVLLTFDDGPHPAYTPQILDILKRYKIKAMFFVVGEKVERYPRLVRRIAAEGHIVGNHTLSHADLVRLRREVGSDYKEQILAVDNLLRNTFGINRQFSYFRPPYGAINKEIKQDLWASGFTVVMWNIDSLDWKLKNAEKIYHHVMNNLPRGGKSGGILLMHDIHKETVEALPLILEGLKERGFTFASPEEFVQRRKAPKKKELEKKTPRPPVASEIQPAKGEGEVTATLLNFRKGPGVGFDKLGRLRRGTKVILLGKYRGWYKIRVGNRTGWVSGRYIRPVEGMQEKLKRMLHNRNP